MRKNELENLIKENFKDTSLRIYELNNEDRKSLLAEYREWIMNDLNIKAVSYTHLTLPTNTPV